MTSRDKHIAQKKKQIDKIHRQQFRLIVKAAKIAGAPYKRACTLRNRMVKIAVITMRVRSLEIQKQMIIAQPISNFIPGGVVPGGAAIIGESYHEMIEIKNGKVEIR